MKSKSKRMTATERDQLARLMYHDSMEHAFDAIERAQMEFFKSGGEVKTLTYRKSRKSERLIKVGVRN
jgi:hypothetical protein